jgi:hypothetical protein
MATKAESYRYFEERSGPKKAPRHWIKLGSRRGGVGLTAHRGPTKKLWDQSPRPLEESAERRYSRVRGRGGINGLKPAHQRRVAKTAERLRFGLKARALSPAARRGAARPRPGRAGSRA